MRRLFIAIALFVACSVYGQPLITEDRMFLTVSADIVKLEQDIYLPVFPGKEPKRFIRWEYEYRNGLLTAERSFPAVKESLWTEQKFEYNADGKLIKDSCSDPSYPGFDFYTKYEYNTEKLLVKAIQINKASGKISRMDTYKKYKKETSYHKVSEFFGDDGVIKYTSVFEHGLKRMVIHTKGFPPVKYEYDSAGRLLSVNNRKFYYKFDKRGNAIASVAIERGMRIYNFIRLTYADGTVTGSLEPDKEFIRMWDNGK